VHLGRDTFTYALVTGEGDADNAAFPIDGDELKVATRLNFELRGTYSLRVQATDAGGARPRRPSRSPSPT
jgi:hypothetical protein